MASTPAPPPAPASGTTSPAPAAAAAAVSRQRSSYSTRPCAHKLLDPRRATAPSGRSFCEYRKDCTRQVDPLPPAHANDIPKSCKPILLGGVGHQSLDPPCAPFHGDDALLNPPAARPCWQGRIQLLRSANGGDSEQIGQIRQTQTRTLCAFWAPSA